MIAFSHFESCFEWTLVSPSPPSVPNADAKGKRCARCAARSCSFYAGIRRGYCPFFSRRSRQQEGKRAKFESATTTSVAVLALPFACKGGGERRALPPTLLSAHSGLRARKRGGTPPSGVSYKRPASEPHKNSGVAPPSHPFVLKWGAKARTSAPSDLRCWDGLVTACLRAKRHRNGRRCTFPPQL